MSYAQCLEYLARLGNEVLTMKFGLESIRKLLDGLGNPHLQYPSVLIAGTNGKGSVARFLSSILSAAGYSSGLYTSPHLVRLIERIVVDGRPVSSRAFARHFSSVIEVIERMALPCHPTYFEILTAAGFLHFAQRKVDIAVLEVGMGGRLDSTNVVDPLLSIFTPIGIDHEAILGNSLQKIAREKAGIIHSTSPVLSARQRRQVLAILRNEARRRHAPWHQLDASEIRVGPSQEGRYGFRFREQDFRLRVYGRHQVDNAALAILAAELLRTRGFEVSSRHLTEGIQGLESLSVLERISEDPPIFVDGAHNVDAGRSLARFLSRHTRPPRSLVFGMMKDKNIGRFLKIVSPCFSRVYLSRIESPRAASVQELHQIFPSGIPLPDPLEAVSHARKEARTVVVTGSFYLAGEVISRFKRAAADRG